MAQISSYVVSAIVSVIVGSLLALAGKHLVRIARQFGLCRNSREGEPPGKP